MSVYALYKGEEIIVIGTLEEIVEHTGLNINTLYHYATPAYKKRIKGENAKVLIKLEDD